ncbi:lipopolysaccharide biosynthesis protein RfbH [Nonomuraea fastidiosa]|uniref:lipopolysaccharide biosynthesis protein RfbH n=1 Tax=Nonomuraea TaxID=83681 RepID=UPI00343E08B9
MIQDTEASFLDQIRRHYRDSSGDPPFVPGRTPILPSGAVLDEDDRMALVEAAMNLRIAAGRTARKFESAFAKVVGCGRAHLTNSGSSANLLAISALTSPQLGERRLRPGDEVITAATGFPTTVNPILQNGLVPVFVDVDLETYNATPDRIEAAIGPRTRAIILAHTLGNPFQVAEVAELARKHDMWLIEDNCDAVGSLYRGRPTGSFGELSTASFYPAHHITMGEGGCVAVSNPKLARIVESFRDWGRDCWCEPGEDNRCLKRFDYQLGTLPLGYDHKYTFSHVGYNLKSTDLQAALGLTQLAKLPAFGEARRRNWRYLREGLADLDEFMMLPVPTPDSDPSWFGFLLTLRPESGLQRRDLLNFLEARRIGTRQLFGGNLTRHPAYADQKFRVSGELTNSDIITTQTFWLGVYPGITQQMADYMIESLHEFVQEHLRAPATVALRS